MVTEINRYIRKSVISLFLMFLCLQGSSCGRDKIVIQTDSEYEQEELTNIDIAKDDSTGDIIEDIAKETSESVEKCFVYVCGAVNFPGVYQLEYGSRLYEAIDKAGGFSDEACESAINLALQVEDGQKVYVPTIEEVKNGEYSLEEGSGGDNSDGLVNINSAGIEELTTLTGVGEVKAAAIIEYRQNNGAFINIEDIMNVSGIGQGSFDKIKNQIKVK